MHPLYTYGYGRNSTETLEQLAKEGALIMDVRWRPASRLPQWTRLRLSNLLGSDYRHVPEMGNVNYKGDLGPDVQIADMEKGLAILREELEQRPVVLLCVCSNLKECHRKVVAAAAAARWPNLEVNHLRASSTTPRRAAVPQGSIAF